MTSDPLCKQRGIVVDDEKNKQTPNAKIRYVNKALFDATAKRRAIIYGRSNIGYAQGYINGGTEPYKTSRDFADTIVSLLVIVRTLETHRIARAFQFVTIA